ncbi:MAG: CHAD domain-containing protein [Terriglobia bacterium]
MNEFSRAATAPAPDPMHHDGPPSSGPSGETADPTAQESADHPRAGGEPAVQEVERVDAWKKVRKLAIKQLDRFMSLEPKVLSGDSPDAIHDLRVASRRLQQVLDLIYPRPRPPEIRKLRCKIRRCRRVLGEVRNCDVQLARVERTLSAKRAARREAWDAVHHYIRQRRVEHFEKALKKISKVNMAVFYVHLKAHLAGNVIAHAAAYLPVTEESGPEKFSERIGRSLETVWQALETQIAQSHGDPRAGVIHGVRIAAKRVRYLIEVVDAFDVSGSREALRWLRSLQTHLGNWHDVEVLEQMMIEMLARQEFLRDQLPIAMGIEKLILRNRKGKESFKEKYFAMTRDSGDYDRVKEWVSGMVAGPEKAFGIEN